MKSYNFYLILVIISFLTWGLKFFSYRFQSILRLKVKKSITHSARVLFFVIFGIGCFSFLILGYGVSRPKIFLGESIKQEKISDMFVVLDVSRSMLANDFIPNRLYVAKNILKNFLKTSPVSRISIILFAEKVFMLSPLTFDYNYLLESVDKINVDKNLGDGTNIGDALALAVDKAKKGKSLRRSVILITDGVAQFESIDPKIVAKDAAKNNIKIYTIGIGTNKNAQIPVVSEKGEIYLSLIPGSSFDLGLLNEISSITNADFFLAGNDNELKQIFDKISRDEELFVEETTPWLYKDFSYEYLSLGVMFLVITFLLETIFLRRSL